MLVNGKGEKVVRMCLDDGKMLMVNLKKLTQHGRQVLDTQQSSSVFSSINNAQPTQQEKSGENQLPCFSLEHLQIPKGVPAGVTLFTEQVLGEGSHCKVILADFYNTAIAVKQYQYRDAFALEYNFYQLSRQHPGLLAFFGAFEHNGT